MVISPGYGLAPLNALTAIKCEMNPTEIIKFDARVLIQIRGGKQLELRLSGESEEPIVDIDLVVRSFFSLFIDHKFLIFSLNLNLVEYFLELFLECHSK